MKFLFFFDHPSHNVHEGTAPIEKIRLHYIVPRNS